MREFLKLTNRIGVLRKYIFLLIARAPFDAFRTWMTAGLMKTVFLCLETGDTGKLSEACIIYGLICVLLFLYNGTIWSIYAVFASKTEGLFQKAMMEKILSLPLQRVAAPFSGEWITKLNSDIQAVHTMMSAPLNIPHMAVSVINTLLSSFLMMKGSFLLFCCNIGIFLPHLLINYKIVLKQIPGLKKASQAAMADNTSAIRPLITEADAILLYDAGELIIKKCEESSYRLMKIN